MAPVTTDSKNREWKLRDILTIAVGLTVMLSWAQNQFGNSAESATKYLELKQEITEVKQTVSKLDDRKVDKEVFNMVMSKLDQIGQKLDVHIASSHSEKK